MKTFFKKRINSSLDEMGEVIREALGALRARGWIKEGQEFPLHLCLEEALVNAIQHGNKCDPGCEVELRMSDDAGGAHCHIYVRDEGEGFRPELIPEPDCEKAGGRGICLIKHFMDRVEFHAGQRCLEMVFSRGTFEGEKASGEGQKSRGLR